MRGLGCYHTWADDGMPKAVHFHACEGQASCHPAPCICACGALDYCTLNRAQNLNNTEGITHVATAPRFVREKKEKAATCQD